MIRDDVVSELNEIFFSVRKYCYEDQTSFAKISGDYNPIHMDFIESRRLLFGEIVVHGMHNVLWCLSVVSERYAKSIKLKSLKAKFIKPVFLGKDVYLKILYSDKNSVDCKIYTSKNFCDGAASIVSFSFDEVDNFFQSAVMPVDFHTECCVLQKEDILNRSFNLKIEFDSNELNKLYPKILSKIDEKQMGFILTTTRLVGMKCPGLNSLYMGLQINFNEKRKKVEEDVMTYSVTSINEEVNAIAMDAFNSHISASIQCLFRPGKVEQLGVEYFLKKINPQEFSSQRALIIGGSRGLGELIVKILACGGAEKINFTYHSGVADALHVYQEIEGINNSIDYFHYDVLTDKENESDAVIFKDITHCYYFSSSKIAANKSSFIDKNSLDNYFSFYLYGLEKITKKLLFYSKNKIKIFNPSTTFIENLELNFFEYVVAKNSSEIYGKYLEKSYENIQFINMRLPKMRTDQTSSIIPEKLLAPADFLIDYLVSNKG